MQDIGSKTKSSLIWNTSLKAVYQTIRFVISIIIARILEPRDFGIVSIATMVIFYANNITHFGFNVALIQRKEITDNHINTVFTINFSIASVLALLSIIFSSQIAVFFKIPELKNVFIILSPLFIVLAFYSFPMSLLERELNYKIVALTGLIQGVISSLIALALTLLGFGYHSLIIGFISSYMIGTIYILCNASWRPKFKYDHPSMKEICSFGLWNLVRSQTFHINEYADKFIIAKFLGPVALGVYDKAFATASLMKQSFTTHFNAVMFSSFSRLQSESNEMIKRYLKKAITLNSLITFPICSGFAALGTHFVLVLLGNKWEPMIVPLKILSVALIFNTLAELLSNLNVSMGYYKKQTMLEGGCNMLLILVCIIAVQYSVEMVAFAVLSVYALSFTLYYYLAKEKIDLRFTDIIESLMPATIGSIGLIVTIRFCGQYYFNDINMINFVFLTLIGAIAYILIILLPNYPILKDYKMSIISRMKSMYSG